MKKISRLRKIFLVFVMFFSVFFVAKSVNAASTWSIVGTAGFTSGEVESPKIAINPVDDKPYVLFKDVANSNKASVVLYDGDSWELVGTAGFSSGEIVNSDISFDPSTGYPYVAFADNNNSLKVTVMRFNGSAWSLVGSAGFSEENAWNIKIDFNESTNQPYVSYTISNGVDNPVYLVKFNESAWEVVGTSNGPGGDSSFSFNDSTNQPYIAYINNSYKITVKKFNGTTWETVGLADFTNSKNATPAHPQIRINNGTPYVAFRDDNNDTVSVMKFNGSSWVEVGDPEFAYGTQFSFSINELDNNPYVACRNSGSTAKLMEYNGSSWVNIGGNIFDFNPDESVDVSLDITAEGIPYVAFDDVNNSEKATVMNLIEEEIQDEQDLTDEQDSHSGKNWRLYKSFKERYKTDSKKKDYWTLRYFKRENEGEFARIRALYLQYKGAGDRYMETLDEKIQNDYKLYKNYRGYKKYRFYKEKVGE